MAQSMFEKYGGFGTVSKVVMAFYDRVLDSEIMGPYFEGVDMRKLIDHQTRFISQLMGGPASYTDSKLQQLHAHKGIHDSAFDEMLDLLTETMEDFEFDDDDIEEIISEMERRRTLIVTPPEASLDSAESGGAR